MKKTRFRTSQRHHDTFFYCYAAAGRALRHAEAERRGSFYFCMMAGACRPSRSKPAQPRRPEEGTGLAALERRLGPREKLLLLRQLLHWSVDGSRRPFQTLRDMLHAFATRSPMARPSQWIRMLFSSNRRRMAGDEWPQPEWKKLCALPSVKRIVEDARAIIRDLAKQSGSTRDPLFSPGHGSSGVTLVDG